LFKSIEDITHIFIALLVLSLPYCAANGYNKRFNAQKEKCIQKGGDEFIGNTRSPYLCIKDGKILYTMNTL
jgi:hypothetical protein